MACLRRAGALVSSGPLADALGEQLTQIRSKADELVPQQQSRAPLAGEQPGVRVGRPLMGTAQRIWRSR
jgi:hypothetical protein